MKKKKDGYTKRKLNSLEQDWIFDPDTCPFCKETSVDVEVQPELSCGDIELTAHCWNCGMSWSASASLSHWYDNTLKKKDRKIKIIK